MQTASKEEGKLQRQRKTSFTSLFSLDDAENEYSEDTNSCINVLACQNLTKIYDVHSTGFVGISNGALKDRFSNKRWNNRHLKS